MFWVAWLDSQQSIGATKCSLAGSCRPLAAIVPLFIPTSASNVLACLPFSGIHMDAGAYSAISADSCASVRLRESGHTGSMRILQEHDLPEHLYDCAESDLGSIDTWPFDDLSCHEPATLHRDKERPSVGSNAAADAGHFPAVMQIGDSAWEILHHERYMKRCSDSSSSTMTYDTFIHQACGGQAV